MIKKIALGLLATLVGGGAIFYFTMVRPPSKTDVCENVVKVQGGDPENKALVDVCTAKIKKGTHQGLLPYAKKLKCMRDAGTPDELSKC